MKNIIVITGGAGFVGTNLIELFLKKTKLNIISIDDYSSGYKKNHINNRRIKYISSHTKNISKKLSGVKKKIQCIFHFGEFARIYQSFLKLEECIESNSIGTHAVFNFCLENNIKLVYSATSATLGNKGNDQNLSPYAFLKAKNLELLENLKKWFNLKYEIIYFYNVYGPKQIKTGDMATVIGIFEDCYQKNKPLPIVKPGTQSRRFTHIYDTVKICYLAWKNNECRHYSISHKQSWTIIQVASLFKRKLKMLKARKGERYASALTSMNLSNKVYKKFGSIKLKDYINDLMKKPSN
ncbi:NAD-dependent epimerase/dehydratase family protein [Candidatus Pelagibacter bacterium]|nr:NAD-dependent epimerase/dehydratase family protein [Candidatus Pelagibacter bacterium]